MATVHGNRNAWQFWAQDDQLNGTNSSDEIFGYAGRDKLFGFQGNDLLDGGSEDDTLLGGSGDDTLIGGEGADDLFGESGIDTVDYSGQSRSIFLDLKAGREYSEGDHLNSIERVIGTRYNDLISGHSANETLDGGRGTDNLAGRDGDDILIGGLHDDILNGGEGSDTLKGGSGLDTASYREATSSVVVSLQLGQGLEGEARGDVLEDIEHLMGSARSDTLVGNEGANRIEGGSAGLDVLIGLGGDDTLTGYYHLEGGEGADRLVGTGGGLATAVYSSSDEGVTINLSQAVQYGGEAEGDTLVNVRRVEGSTQMDRMTGSVFNDRFEGDSGSDILFGDGGHDTLWGEDGHDTLEGGAGRDALKGGDGFDIMSGGAGRDSFSFNFDAASSDHDIIIDFQPGIDVIVVERDDPRDGNPDDPFANFGDLFAAAAQVGSDVVIDTGSGGVTLANVQLDNLQEGDFFFS